MKQIQPFQKHWLQLTSIVVCRLNMILQWDVLSDTETVPKTPMHKLRAYISHKPINLFRTEIF